MECAFTICAQLYIPYGHRRNISISFSLRWQTTATQVSTLTWRNYKTCSNARQLFTLKTHNGRGCVMLSRWQLAEGIMTPSRSICRQAHSLGHKSSKQTVLEGQVHLLGHLLIVPSARSSTSSPISNWGLKMDYKQHQTLVDPFLLCDCSTHTMCSKIITITLIIISLSA